MKSVRLRLLTLALLPMVVLMPLMLLLGMNRWTSEYDNILIANVASDLRIAEQYLGRILDGTGTHMTGITESAEFLAELDQNRAELATFLKAKQRAYQLDFLYYLPPDQTAGPAHQWPVIASAKRGRPATAIDIFSAADLAALPGDLATRARVPLIETQAAVPTTRTVEDRGMVVHTASPVGQGGNRGVLVGGILLNRNLGFIDTINALVYLNAATGGDRQGTATLFLEDVRVSTNVRLFEDVRALGTRVSAVVRGKVLDDGKTWLDRAFVVNDWYISGYLPISDSFGERVGMLYVGFLEAPFVAAKQQAYLALFIAFLLLLAVSIPFFLRMAKGIFSPLERMIQTMTRVEKGDLNARNGDVGSNDEIGLVASHLDTLLDQVQERDQALRSWADELNERVEDRTAELKEANYKLEETFKQLVMSEKLASIGEITAGVAHEINNPVAVIQGNVDVIRQTLDTRAEEVATELSLIDRQVQRIGAIVGKLLQFARPSEFSSSEETVDIGRVTEDSLVLIGHTLSNTQITVETDLAPAPPVRIDEGELQQVIVNLLVNAVQAMEQDGRLTVSLFPEELEGKAGTCLQIADTGPGIPDENLNTLFDPFFTTKLAEGTGLGLSISQTLIQRAGGLIRVRNRRKRGAAFSIWLPEAPDSF
ncbi:cache domain-containing protein [Sulfitobacter mediterraneus]|uniref:sensor histidine kinase n=1 Tax=Sulfitobacter mediterraneus TaxID=83219 RepID=UPI001932B56B|nr:cache domain-containing protein [Sulfitobacter mediterraneus]MBM1633587.1 cache domain-containing protein [Sulfitobacter mediterraneus]MBM1641898.1 cache domain-containing protein [Sulfitobacter mediterraneus]MBM1645451.1 cache domain-containing protein [Sulfitobacter mediterraneus]MBM1650017.1 cache domain-containing protein [Sulfitobacter mediterraneus]MBM1653520.1 cache domain-containing protein [Sulfitobacter mediterraneus]